MELRYEGKKHTWIAWCRPPFGIHYTSFLLQLIFAGGRLSRCHMLSPDWLVRNHNSAFEEATKRRHLARNLQERILSVMERASCQKWETHFLQASYMKHLPEQLTVAMTLVGMVTSWVRNRRAVGERKEKRKKRKRGRDGESARWEGDVWEEEKEFGE